MTIRDLYWKIMAVVDYVPPGPMSTLRWAFTTPNGLFNILIAQWFLVHRLGVRDYTTGDGPLVPIWLGLIMPLTGWWSPYIPLSRRMRGYMRVKWSWSHMGFVYFDPESVGP